MSVPADESSTPTEPDALYRLALPHVGYRDQLELGAIRRGDFQRFAIAVGDLNPVYFDESAARAAGYPRLAAPPLYIASVMGWRPGPPEAELREDGLAEADSFLIPIPGLRLMGGGQELGFHGAVLEDTVVTMRRELADVQLRAGRSGPLVVFAVRRTYVDERGVTLVTCVETFIGRLAKR